MNIDVETRKKISFFCLGVCLLLTLIGILVLPAEVTMPIASFADGSKLLGKPMALVSSTVLGVGFSLLGAYYEHEKKDALAYMVGAIAMVVLQALTLLTNL